jgi:hypothetical protein
MTGQRCRLWVTSGGARVAPRAYGLPRIADEFLHAEVGSFVPNSEVVRLARSNSEEHLAGQLMPGILSQLRARRSALAQQRLHRPYGQNNYLTLGASDVRRVATSPLPLFIKNRLIVFERAAAANGRLSNRARQ